MPPPQPVPELTAHLGYWLRFVSNHVSRAFARKVEAAYRTMWQRWCDGPLPGTAGPGPKADP